MKQLTLLIYFLSTFCIYSPQTTHSKHWHEYYPGGYWVTNLNLASGDTLHMNKGVYTYISGENLNNVTIIADAGTEMRSGFNFINSSNIHFNFFDANTGAHNLYIHDATGIGIQGSGKCSNWVIDGVDMYNVYSCLWFKTDPDEFHIKNKKGKDSLDNSGHIILDTSGWHYVMDGLTIKHCNWKRANFDLAYIGNTDPQGNRTYWVNGQWIHVIPDPVAHVYIEDLQCDTAYRTVMQVSGLKDTLIVKNSSFKNAGINSYLDADGKNQGCDFIIGGANNPIYALITNCVFKNSNLNNFKSQPGGTIVFSNNTTDSATAVYRIGQGFGVNSQTLAAVEFDNPVPTLLDIENNSIGWSNNNVGVVVYGSAKTGSKFSNNQLKGLFQNKTTTVFDTTGNVVKDTTKKDTSTSVWKLNYKDSTVTHDTAYIIKTTTTHDTVYVDSVKISLQPQSKTQIGIMPFSVASTYGVRVTRDAYRLEYFSNALTTANLIKRFNSYDTLLLNINHYNGEFTDNVAKHTDSVRQIADKVNKWVYLVDENEELQPVTHPNTNIVDYCAQLVSDATAYPGRVANGGFTMHLYQWYYSQTMDADFAAKCLPNGGKSIDRTRVTDLQYELDIMHQINVVANIHFYLSDTAQIPCIIRMIKYAQTYLNRDRATPIDWISNEAGIYKQDPALVKGIVAIARATGMKFVILYSGDGSIKALTIMKNDFETARLN